MNKERRKEIQRIAEQVAELLGAAEDLKSQIEAVRDDEQDYLDSMPESLQGGEKGERAQAATEALEEAMEALESLTDTDFSSLFETAAE